MSNTYKLGQSVRIRAEFRDVDGALIDPATVIAMIKSPDEVEVSYEYGVDIGVVRDSLGTYHYWVATDQEGTYAYRWKGLDAVNVANEDAFEVAESAFTTP